MAVVKFDSSLVDVERIARTIEKETRYQVVKKEIILQSVINCPNCVHQKEENMPTDACKYLYACEQCQHVLKPKGGSCCVYCSFGSVACPPIQQSGNKSCCN